MSEISDLKDDCPTTMVAYATVCATELFACNDDFHLSLFLNRLNEAIAHNVDATSSSDDQARLP